MAALDLDDRELLVKAVRTGLQLDGLSDRTPGLIKAVNSREITSEPAIPVGLQRLGGESLLRELNRLIHLTERRTQGPEGELGFAVIRRRLKRTPKLRFGSAPVKSAATNR